MSTVRVKRQTQSKSVGKATLQSQSVPCRMEKRLCLELPLLSEVYKTHTSTTSATRNLQQKRLARKQQQQQQLQLTQKTKQPQNEETKQVKPPTQIMHMPMYNDSYKPVRTLKEPEIDVRSHIEAAKQAKLAHHKLVAATKLATVPTTSTALMSAQSKTMNADMIVSKMVDRERANELQAQKKLTRANCIYFDRYLKSAFDLSKPDALRKLEAHFFPNAGDKNVIGDSPDISKTRIRRRSRATSAEDTGHKNQLLKRRSVSDVSKVVNKAKGVQSKDLKAAKQRASKKQQQPASSNVVGRDMSNQTSSIYNKSKYFQD